MNQFARGSSLLLHTHSTLLYTFINMKEPYNGQNGKDEENGGHVGRQEKKISWEQIFVGSLKDGDNFQRQKLSDKSFMA